MSISHRPQILSIWKHSFLSKNVWLYGIFLEQMPKYRLVKLFNDLKITFHIKWLYMHHQIQSAHIPEPIQSSQLSGSEEKSYWMGFCENIHMKFILFFLCIKSMKTASDLNSSVNFSISCFHFFWDIARYNTCEDILKLLKGHLF